MISAAHIYTWHLMIKCIKRARATLRSRWNDHRDPAGEEAAWLSHGLSLEQQLAELSDGSLPELTWVPHTILQAQQAQIAEAEQCCKP